MGGVTRESGQSDPDLALALAAERFAPRLARQAVGQLDNPSPDLRAAGQASSDTHALALQYGLVACAR